MEIRREGGGVEHVAQVDDGDGEDDDEGGSRVVDELRGGELRGAREHDRGHGLRRGEGNPGVDGQRAVDQAEGKDANKKREFGANTRPEV